MENSSSSLARQTTSEDEEKCRKICPFAPSSFFCFLFAFNQMKLGGIGVENERSARKVANNLLLSVQQLRCQKKESEAKEKPQTETQSDDKL